MERRSILKLISAAGLFGFASYLPKGGTTSRRPRDGHVCDDYCYDAAEKVARQIIKETGLWKISMHDWTKRTMVVTRHGQEACVISLSNPSHHPYWVYNRRPLTEEESASFAAQYGRSQWILLGSNLSSNHRIRGFILDGRIDGWNFSTESL